MTSIPRDDVLVHVELAASQQASIPSLKLGFLPKQKAGLRLESNHKNAISHSVVRLPAIPELCQVTVCGRTLPPSQTSSQIPGPRKCP